MFKYFFGACNSRFHNGSHTRTQADAIRCSGRGDFINSSLRPDPDAEKCYLPQGPRSNRYNLARRMLTKTSEMIGACLLKYHATRGGLDFAESCVEQRIQPTMPKRSASPSNSPNLCKHPISIAAYHPRPFVHCGLVVVAVLPWLGTLYPVIPHPYSNYNRIATIIEPL